jgi:signal peptidase I
MQNKTKAAKFIEFAEQFFMAAVIVFMVRAFMLEAFQIPTGSMAPTLLGVHETALCTTTNLRFPTTVYDNHQPVSPITGEPALLIEPHHWLARLSRLFTGLSGDKIMVNKFIYHFSPPRRWDAIVFKYPEDTSKNYIKRLIGRPGETVEIRHGDIFINGRIARKPKKVQQALSYMVYDSRLFTNSQAEDFWVAHRGSWKIEGGIIYGKTEGNEKAYLTYEKEIRDYTGYNPPTQSGMHIVGDIKLIFKVRLEKGAAAALAIIAEDERNFILQLAGNEHEEGSFLAVRTRPGAGTFFVERDKNLRLRAGTTYEVEFSNLDDLIEVRLDEKIVFKYDYQDEPRWWFGWPLSGIGLGVVDGGAQVSDLSIWRDIYYIPGVERSWLGLPYSRTVPQGMYFVLGDNSSTSRDSRVWGYVPHDFLVGKAFFLWWPFNRVKFIH